MTPPRLAESLLRRALPPDEAEAIAGDLEEMFRDYARARGVRAARRWYWGQVLSVVSAHVRRRNDPPSDVPSRKRLPMSSIRQDLSYAVRSLRKQPGFTVVAVLMLALGIGANVAIFSLCHAVLFKRLPFSDPQRLMLVLPLAPDEDAPGVWRRMIWSFPKYVAFRDAQRVFTSTALYTDEAWNLTGSGSPDRLTGELVEASYFETLGVAPQIGRTFTADETRHPGSAPLAILSYRLWATRFGSDPNVPGRTIGLNGIPHTIVGVLPAGFSGLTGQADVWVPVMTRSADDLGEAWNHSYNVVARRKPAISAEQADAETAVVGRQVSAQYPKPRGGDAGWSATAISIDEQRADGLVRRTLLLLLGAVAVVLLIVCINLANLTLTRGISREREVGIRLALGAGRLRIVRQFMTESALLALLGAGVGVCVAYVALLAGASLMPDLRIVLPQDQSGDLTRVGLHGVGLDRTVLLFTVLLAMATGALFGLAPAWRVARRDLTETMKRGAAGAVSHGTHALGLRNLLIVGEIALALVVLGAGGLMLKSLARLHGTELGFKPDSLLAVRLTPPSPQYDPARATQLMKAMLERVAGRADVELAAFGSCAPVSAWCNRTSMKLLDRPPARPDEDAAVGVLWVSPKYFETLGVRLVRGRLFADRDRTGQPKVVVISESAARQFWRNQDPIGRRVALGQGGFSDGAEIIGIVADVHYGAVETAVMPHVYLPLDQSPRRYGYLFVRSRTSPDLMTAALRQEIKALDPDLPLTDIRMMDDRFADAIWRTRVSAWLLTTFAALALLLATMGIYGVISQGVAQRRREIGVRLALGAARAHILRLVIGRAFGVAVGGIAIGLALALPAMRVLRALLYQVEPGDPGILGVLSLLLLAVAISAAYVPARRATRVDPLTTLRVE
jgi:predicted permease